MKFGKALLITTTMFLAVSAHASSQAETTAEAEKKVQVIEFDDAEAAYIIVVTREGKTEEQPSADRAPASTTVAQVLSNK